MTWSEIKEDAISRLLRYASDHPDKELKDITETLQNMLADTEDIKILRMQRVSSLPIQTDSAPVYISSTKENFSVLTSRFAQFLFNGDYDKSKSPYDTMYIIQDPEE